MISQEKLKEITKQEPGTDLYRLAVMSIKQQIERQLEERGYPVTIKHEKDALRILLDAEASDHNARQAELSIRRLRRSHQRSLCVDVRNLNEEEQTQHSRHLLWQGAMVGAIKKAGRELRLEKYTNPSRQALQAEESK